MNRRAEQPGRQEHSVCLVSTRLYGPTTADAEPFCQTDSDPAGFRIGPAWFFFVPSLSSGPAQRTAGLANCGREYWLPRRL